MRTETKMKASAMCALVSILGIVVSVCWMAFESWRHGALAFSVFSVVLIGVIGFQSRLLRQRTKELLVQYGQFDDMDVEIKTEVISKDDFVKSLVDQVNELEVIFELRRKADMRAIRVWQAARPGREMVWPDHADLCMWLLEQLDAAKKADKDVEIICSHCGRFAGWHDKDCPYFIPVPVGKDD